MAMDPREIERLIKAGIPDADVRIEDLAGDGDHYAAYIVSAAFKGQPRLVYRVDAKTARVLGSFPAGPGAFLALRGYGSMWVTSYAGADVWRFKG